ncbi:glutaminyl-peptide cyclotransferase isoform X2 [Senna tora]|uniref:Glutaminyl-peptide cyclotransferase isoform X2 n=1 Tax=Senna tora TaxID=362788 RepID=A0A834WJ08_9FABA|nr:glutaminyl-peptide cyclotransferase isoform X2 [Senna tora]
MGSRSLRKRPHKQLNLEPHASMASVPSRRKIGSYTKVSVLLSASLTIGVIGLLVISSNSWRNVKSGVSYEMVRVVNEFPHDHEAFTQGLLYDANDTLFESTGLYEKSSVRKVTLHTGKVEVIQKMDGSLFGEGLTLLGESFSISELLILSSPQQQRFPSLYVLCSPSCSEEEDEWLIHKTISSNFATNQSDNDIPLNKQLDLSSVQTRPHIVKQGCSTALISPSSLFLLPCLLAVLGLFGEIGNEQHQLKSNFPNSSHNRQRENVRRFGRLKPGIGRSDASETDGACGESYF